MKKRITSILVVLSMALSLMPFFALPASAVTAVAPLNSADSDAGTETNPYQIATAGNLVWFRDKINDGTIVTPNQSAVLTTDIDFQGEYWTPIGVTNKLHLKYGYFDGRNHTISNFKLSPNNSSLVGFFDVIGTGYTLKNLHVRNNLSMEAQYLGGIVGVLTEGGTVDNCSFVGDLTSTHTDA
ncbi:MAG: hypothetical protein IJG16_08940, partial [Clostridia bacterium]|nr:hypothetical protein [Clostridia bacterium]